GHRLPQILAEGVRRDRAVGARSERALVEQRREAGEELALARRPVGRPAHDGVELLRERLAEELGPVEQRLDHAERLAAGALADLGEHRRRLAGVAVVDAVEPDHPITRSAASRRRSPSRIAAPTVCSKMTSSSIPAAFSAATSSSVTVRASVRTFARYGSIAAGGGGRASAFARSRSVCSDIRRHSILAGKPHTEEIRDGTGAR